MGRVLRRAAEASAEYSREGLEDASAALGEELVRVANRVANGGPRFLIRELADRPARP